MPRVRSIFRASCYIVILILINFVISQSPSPIKNSIKNRKQLSRERGKRILTKDTSDALNVKIKYKIKAKTSFPSGIDLELMDEGEISLKWVKQRSHLANNYLPVFMNDDNLSRNVMDHVGEFVSYQDIEKCSAVIHFKESNTLSGYIGLNYVIANLPFNFDKDGNYVGIAEEPMIVRRLNIGKHDNEPITSLDSIDLSDLSSHGLKRPSDPEPEPGPSKKRHREKRDFYEEIYELVNGNASTVAKIRKTRAQQPWSVGFYLEILVFIASDVVELYKALYDEEIYIKMIVSEYVWYFNAVDMMFQKLRPKQDRLYINIAKIIIEDPAKPFDFMNTGEFQFIDVVSNLRKYLSTHRQTYTPDSFDYVFVFTSRPIMHGTFQVPGKTDRITDLYEARKTDKWYDAFPITVLEYVADYATAVHHISLTLEIEPDLGNTSPEATEQCSSLMQVGGSKCDNCLRWTDNHEKAFETFIKTNRNRCFLLNEPKSIRPPKPDKYVTAFKQCLCFGYEFFMRNNQRDSEVGKDDCHLPLQCGKVVDGRLNSADTLIPFDGTTCRGEHKVCWVGECIPIEHKKCTKERKPHK